MKTERIKGIIINRLIASNLFNTWERRSENQEGKENHLHIHSSHLRYRKTPHIPISFFPEMICYWVVQLGHIPILSENIIVLVTGKERGQERYVLLKNNNIGWYTSISFSVAWLVIVVGRVWSYGFFLCLSANFTRWTTRQWKTWKTLVHGPTISSELLNMCNMYRWWHSSSGQTHTMSVSS